MLRYDGYFVIYCIQHNWEKREKEKWVMSAQGGGFMGSVPVELRFVGNPNQGKGAEPFASFSASGRCWQETGVHGTYDFHTARMLCELLVEYNPNHDFRVVRVTIEQSITTIESLESWET